MTANQCTKEKKTFTLSENDVQQDRTLPLQAENRAVLSTEYLEKETNIEFSRSLIIAQLHIGYFK